MRLIHTTSAALILVATMLSGTPSPSQAQRTSTETLQPCAANVTITIGSSSKSELPVLTPELTAEPFNQEFRDELLTYASESLLPHVNPLDGLISQDGSADLRSSAVAAILWAETGQVDLARQAIVSILGEQIRDNLSDSYGNFPFQSGGQSQRLDNNWSAFIGTSLILFHDRYHDEYDATFIEDVRQGIGRAAIHTSCQNMFIEHTNIALLRAFLLIRSGEILDDETLLASGRSLWNLVLFHTLNNGISEYNSPNYMRISIWALSFMVEYVEDAVVSQEAERVRLLFWWSLTNHYHSVAAQIVGPFSRTFTDRMKYELTHSQPLLHVESQGKIPLLWPGNAQGSHAINLVYPLILEPSWPLTWIDTALSIPCVGTFREQVALRRRGFIQTTTYKDERQAVGSVNVAEVLGPPGESRPINAYRVSEQTGDVGVFRISFNSPEHIGLKTVQNDTSILGLLWIGRSRRTVSEQEVVEVTFQWAGTDRAIPSQLLSSTVEIKPYEITAHVYELDWMEGLTRLAIIENSSFGAVLQISENTVTDQHLIEKKVTFELPAGLSELTTADMAFVPLLFAIDFSLDATAQFNADSIVIDQVDDILAVSWQSPSGLLTMQVPKNALTTVFEWERLVSFVDHVEIEATPLNVR